MGLRATVIKEYRVEYGEKSGFNNGAEYLVTLIQHFCPSAWCGGEDFSEYAIWEVPKDEFTGMVQDIARMTEDDFATVVARNEYTDSEYTREYVLGVFRGWLEETPPDSDYVRFGWL